MAKIRSKSDWHRADIVAAIIKSGTSLASLGRENGLSSTTLKNALDKPYPRAERIIAGAIGKKPEELWPSRYPDNTHMTARSL